MRKSKIYCLCYSLNINIYRSSTLKLIHPITTISMTRTSLPHRNSAYLLTNTYTHFPHSPTAPTHSRHPRKFRSLFFSSSNRVVLANEPPRNLWNLSIIQTISLPYTKNSSQSPEKNRYTDRSAAAAPITRYGTV